MAAGRRYRPDRRPPPRRSATRRRRARAAARGRQSRLRRRPRCRRPRPRRSALACGTMQGWTRCSSPSSVSRAMPKQLDAIAQLLGELDVEPGDVADALGVDAGEIDRPAEPDARQDRELVRGVDPVDVKARIGLGIAELLRLGQHLGEFAAALAHRRQDVVRGAVQDAVDAFEPVAGEPLAQRLDDRDAAGDRGFEGRAPRPLPRPARRASCRHAPSAPCWR